MTRTAPARRPRPARLLARAAVIAAMVCAGLLAPAVAWGHVSVDSSRPNGDGTTTVVLVFDHACIDSPTVSLDVAASAGVEFLAGSTAIPGWTGNLVLPTRINFLGEPVPSGQPSSVEIRARITGTPGEPIYFPTFQRCADGHGYSWTDTAAGAEYPSPVVIATTAILAPTTVSPSEPAADLLDVLIGIMVLVLAVGGAGGLISRRSERGRNGTG